MKKNINIIILGGDINGLYIAIRCIDMGYNVTIIEKKKKFGNIKNNNYTFFNKNHSIYINLLKRFNVKYSKYSFDKNNNLLSFLMTIINKSKIIPKKVLLSLTFNGLCEKILSKQLLKDFKNYTNSFQGLTAFFDVINSVDFIEMFITEICNDNIYKLDDKIEVLINRMTEYLINKGALLINNTNVKSFKYINKKFILNNIIYTSDILVSTISKKNLIKFTFWNDEQYNILNNITHYNFNTFDILKSLSIIHNDYIEDDYENDVNIRNNILNNLHIIYPINKQNNNELYLWNTNVNNIIIREKIKNLYNQYFLLCSNSYSKNSMFLNYGLEIFDNNIQHLNKISNYI
jgi:hypothetical protein